MDTVWIITSHTVTSTAVAVRDIELDRQAGGLIMVTTMARATMATGVRRSTTTRGHHSSIHIIRPRRHIRPLRFQPARAAAVAGIRAEPGAVAGTRAEVLANNIRRWGVAGIRAESAGGRSPRATFSPSPPDQLASFFNCLTLALTASS